MIELSRLMFILALISMFQWPNSIGQHVFILFVNSHRNSTSYDTEETTLFNQDNRTTTTTSSYKEDRKIDHSIQNIRFAVATAANLTNSSSIVFPTSTVEKIKFSKLIPEKNAILKCSLNQTFCIQVDNYPREHLSNIFRTSKHMSTATYIDIHTLNEVNNFDTRITPDSQLESFCESRSFENIQRPITLTTKLLLKYYHDHSLDKESDCAEHCLTEVIYPEAGLTSKNEWRYIVQTPAINDNGTYIKQGIVVEKCTDIRAPCKFDDTLPIGYVSTCIQKYIYKRLISIEGSHHFYYDTFKFPSCCQCMYTINTDLLTKMGGD